MSAKRKKPRNPLHAHPLLGKGGVHDKSNKTRRRHDKVQLRREYPSDSAATNCITGWPLPAFCCTPITYVALQTSP